jgi:hypothetical protein
VAQVPTCYPHLARAFFGIDAFTPDGICMKEPVRRFVETVVICKWRQLKRCVERERVKLPLLKKEVDSLWKGMWDIFLLRLFYSSSIEQPVDPTELIDIADSGHRPKTYQIRAWSSKLSTLTKILTRYADKDSLEQLLEQRERLVGVLDAMGLDPKGHDKIRM